MEQHVVDPRLAAGRGEEYRIEAVRQRQLEEMELQRLDDGDFRCAATPRPRGLADAWRPRPACLCSRLCSAHHVTPHAFHPRRGASEDTQSLGPCPHPCRPPLQPAPAALH